MLSTPAPWLGDYLETVGLLEVVGGHARIPQDDPVGLVKRRPLLLSLIGGGTMQSQCCWSRAKPEEDKPSGTKTTGFIFDPREQHLAGQQGFMTHRREATLYRTLSKGVQARRACPPKVATGTPACRPARSAGSLQIRAGRRPRNESPTAGWGWAQASQAEWGSQLRLRSA